MREQGSWARLERGLVMVTVAATALVGVGCDYGQLGQGDLTPQSGASKNGPPPATPALRPPRPLSPLSGSISGSRQPVLRWTPNVEATIQICADRACANVLVQESADGSFQPPAPLQAGVLFWRVSAGRTSSAVWQLTIPGRDSGEDIAWGVVPDFNGDGRADVAIGAPAAGAGSVSVFDGGGPAGASTSADVTLWGGAGFGRAVASAGDVNGDGFVDLAVAAGEAPGAVSVYLGGPAGPHGGTLLWPGPVTSGFGATIASAGDVNHDGYGDLLVGGHETAQIFLGGPFGISKRATATATATATAGFALVGSADNGLNGDATVVQGPADVNADGAPDLYVGGALYLSGPSGLMAEGGFTQVLGSFAGDENGDGFVDFASDQVSPGTPDGVDAASFLFVQAGELTFETAGDLDGDGYSDVISSISSLVGVPERERVYFGAPGSCGSTGCRRFSAIQIPGHDNRGGDLSAFVAAVGDVDGDGIDDLVASTPANGTAYLFKSGGATGMPISFAFPIWTGAPGFGSSITTLFGTARSTP